MIYVFSRHENRSRERASLDKIMIEYNLCIVTMSERLKMMRDFVSNIDEPLYNASHRRTPVYYR